MIYRNKILILVLAWGLWFSAQGDAAEKHDLAWALSYAKLHNPELSAYRESARAAKAKVPQAWSLEDPQGGVNFYNVPTGSKNPFDTTEYRYFLEQKLPFAGKIISQGKMAKKEYQMTLEESRAKELEILTEVKHAFHDLSLLEHRSAINQESQELLKSAEKVALTKYGANQGHFQDTLKASLEISRLEQEALTLEKEKVADLAHLNRLLGRHFEEPLVLETEHHPTSFSYSLEQLLTMAREHQPEIRASQLATARERANLSLARQQFIPDLSLGVEYMQREHAENALSYKVGMNIPIFSLWKQRNGVVEAKARWNAARSMETEATNVVEEEVQVGWADLERAKKTVQLYETAALPQARAATKAAQVSYETGQTDFLNLIDLEKTLKMTEENYWEAAVDYEKAVAHLEYLVGKNLTSKETL